MATLTAVNPTVSKGDHMETVKKLILNGQSWSAGQLLFADANGLLKACASNADAGTGGIKYYALTAQTDPGDSTTYAEVAVITPSTIFEGHELDGVVADANVGESYAIDVTANVCTVDVGDTTNVAVVITEIASDYERIKNAAADVKGRCRFRVLPVALNAVGA